MALINNIPRIYMIVNITRNSLPTVFHYTLEEAKQEAARLAKKNPDNRFAVFSPVISYICQMPEPTETIHL